MNDSLPRVIGVVGAGTMGAGIAQLAATAGLRTRLHDPLEGALERGLATVDKGLERLVSRNRLDADDAAAARERIQLTAEPTDLADCDFVIEAVPERIDLKVQVFKALSEVVTPECVLATNTSSLSVSELAAAVPEPGRVVGLHFFNPAPVMRLVEVVAGQASQPSALATARAVGEAMGKRVIAAEDIPGFIVNRCNRPYSLESLRLLEAQVATTEQIDRIARMAGGFRMGPFELMDLIGLETNHAVAEGFHRQTFGEPRYQPSQLQARMIAAGRLGRKTGAGWYDYADGEGRPSDPEPEAAGGGDGRSVLVLGDIPLAVELRSRLADVGFAMDPQSSGEAWLTLVCGLPRPDVPGPRAQLLAPGSLHALDPVAAGFHAVPPLAGARLIEVTSTMSTDPTARERLGELVHALGCVEEHVDDAPGLVLGRIVSQLVNEAAFLIGAANATPEDVDAGMQLGVNHPRGPVAWSKELGLEHVVSILDGLHRELGEERYRVAPLLRRRLALEQHGLQ